MKKILFTFILFFGLFRLNSNGQIQLFEEEISLEVEGFTIETQTEVIYTLKAIGTVWANSSITNQYLTAYDTVFGNYSGAGRGWRIFWETNSFDPIAHGFYKLYTNYGTNYVYLDLRDCNWANKSYPNQYYTDFSIKYNAKDDKFFYKDHNASSYTEIPDTNFIGIWEIKNGTRVESCFENFWSNSLIAPIEEFRFPHIIWSKYPGFTNIDSYKLSRGMVDLNNNTVPNDDSFVLVTTENNTVFDYEDEDESYVTPINNSYGWPYIALYYVKAKSGTTLSPRTNIVPVFSLIPWSNALILINEKNNPLLMWDEYKGFDAANISGYKIYRGMPSPIKPSLFIFSPIATVNKDEIQFIDHDIFLSSSSSEVRYYVKAILSQGESSATNTVSANGGLYKNSPPRSIT